MDDSGSQNHERAFACWAAMCRQRSALACLVPADPLYDSVRQDVRFRALFGSLRIPIAEKPPRALRSAAGAKDT